MKKKRLISFAVLLCIALSVMATGSTFAKYLDTFEGPSFQLSAKASVYTLNYDTGASDTQLGDALFTIREEDPVKDFFTFNGWSDGEREALFQKGDSYQATGLITNLTSQWKPHWDLNGVSGGGNNGNSSAFTDVTVDDQGNLTIQQEGKPACEIIGFPLENLIPNARYTISLHFSLDSVNPADVIKFYPLYANSGNHEFGFSIESEYNSTLTGCQRGTNNTTLDCEFDRGKGSKDYAHTFQAEASTMYLRICTCALRDIVEEGVPVTMTIKNLTLQRVALPYVQMSHMNQWGKEAAYTNTNRGTPTVQGISDSDTGASINIKGVSGVEIAYIPIKNLAAGQNYRLTFDFQGLSNKNQFVVEKDVVLENGDRYWYGYAMVDNLTKEKIDTPKGYDYRGFTLSGNAVSYTADFKAVDTDAYLVFNFGNVVDGQSFEFVLSNVALTEGAGSGGSLLSLVEPEEPVIPQIQLDYSGIGDNLDWWMADVEMQLPVPGEDYGLVFEACEGYCLSDTIGVTIDGVSYPVSTNGSQSAEDTLVPTFDPETGTLTIPAGLLQDNTRTVAIDAAAVEITSEAAAPSEEQTETVSGETALSDETTKGAASAEPIVNEDVGETTVNSLAENPQDNTQSAEYSAQTNLGESGEPLDS